MSDNPKMRRIISIKTPVVLYDKIISTESNIPEQCISDFKSILKHPNETKSISDHQVVYQALEKKALKRHARSFDHPKRQKPFMINHSPIILKCHRFPDSSCQVLNRNSYQEILDKISYRMNKLKVRDKSSDFAYRINPMILPLDPIAKSHLPRYYFPLRKRIFS